MGNCVTTTSAPATGDITAASITTNIKHNNETQQCDSFLPKEGATTTTTTFTNKKQKQQQKQKQKPPYNMNRRNTLKSLRHCQCSRTKEGIRVEQHCITVAGREETKEGEIVTSNNYHGISSLNLEDTLHMAQLLLETRQDESKLNNVEVKVALLLYRELQRVLSVATRSGNLMAQPAADFHPTETTFHDRYKALVKEFDDANKNIEKALASPAAVQPLSVQSLEEANDFFILDNSLRETTVGAARGHTLEEKLKIAESMAQTGLEEVILGAFGAKVSVDSQIAAQWKRLGKSYDNTWGFSDAYDMIPMSPEEEERVFTSIPDYFQAEARGETIDFFTPSSNPKSTYSKADIKLLEEAYKGFAIAGNTKPFGGKSPEQILKESESEEHGRVPLGLIMMAGYGICNACIELDTSVETFDYDKYDIVERCKFLIAWCKTNFPKRQNVPHGQDNTARVLINLRDFTNYNRSEGGIEEALRLVHELSSLPSHQRPFGFMMEEPTGHLWPDEVGKLCRMIRLTMNRAGFPQGRFLVHVHWYFGLAEATQLTSLCNGADGCWAAVCKVGAQVGHACSTMTAVNLLRAGHQEIAEKYNLANMRKAAREVTEISTRRPCPTHEEIYGELAFDIPFIMVPDASRYELTKLLKSLDTDERVVRLNEIIFPSAIHKAMVYHFGQPEESGWDPQYCPQMYTSIHDHLLTGLSRDYKSALGLGHLYGLVSQKKLPEKLIRIMLRDAPIPDYHPTVLEFISRWNRLCLKYEGIDQPHPVTESKSIMMWGDDVTVQPRRTTLPFEYFLADVMRNRVLSQTPRLFKQQIVSLVTKHECEIQGTVVPEINFFETVLRLKLFILEAESLGVLGLVDDFCIRKNHDYLFGEDHLWIQKVRGTNPQILNKMIRSHIDFFPKYYYVNKGNNAMVRCVRAAANRIEDNKGITEEMRQSYRRGSSRKALNIVLNGSGSGSGSGSMKDLLVQHPATTLFSETNNNALMTQKELAEEGKEEDDDEESAHVDLKQNMTLVRFP